MYAPLGGSTTAYDPTQDPSIPPQTRIGLAWAKVQLFHGAWGRGMATNILGSITATQTLRR